MTKTTVYLYFCPDCQKYSTEQHKVDAKPILFICSDDIDKLQQKLKERARIQNGDPKDFCYVIDSVFSDFKKGLDKNYDF